MSPDDLLHAAARSWERAGHPFRAAERYSQAHAWAEAGRCWAEAGRPVDAAGAYGRAGESIHESRQWLSSPWPERGRSSYERALERGLGASAKVEALLGLGEIDQAAQRAFVAASQERRSVDALRALARLAAIRGRPDLAARAWERAIARSPASAAEVFEDWEGASSWNRSLVWGRPSAEVFGWPSCTFRDVRLELVWEEKLGRIMYGNRGLAWSDDGRRFAAAKQDYGNLTLGDFTGSKIRLESLDLKAKAVAFVPKSDSVLVGCRQGHVVRVSASGAVKSLAALQIPDHILGVAFSPLGDRVAVTAYTSPGALLRVWSWDSKGPREILYEEQTQEGTTNPSCAWSPDGQVLAWCPGPWSRNSVRNDIYLFSEAGTRGVLAAHKNKIDGMSFSPSGAHLIAASLDRTLSLREGQSGKEIAAPWICPQRLHSSVFHPDAAIIAAGGPQDGGIGYRSPSCLYLLRLSQDASPYLEVIQEHATETAVCSLAFSPDGEYLLMGTNDRLSLFRVHLT